MDLYALIKGHEGLRLTMYHDATNHPTLGYGHELSTPITELAADMILRDDVRKLQIKLDRLPWYEKLDYIRQAAIVDMAFNVGFDGLLEFEKMIDALAHQNWVGAHDQVMNSKWLNQVGNRARDVAKMLLTGLWPQ